VAKADIRHLRLISRQRQKLVGMLASEKNRMHKVLSDAGKFQALSLRKGHKRSIVALAHKMLRIIYAMLSKQTHYKDKSVDYEALMVARIQLVIDEVESVLKFEGIEAVGICAYSSTLRKVITHRGKPLMDHFIQINQQCNTRERLEGRLAEVFDMYDEAIQSDIDAIREQKIAMNGLHLDALEIGGTVLYQKMLKSISKIDQKLDATTFEQWLKDSQRLRVSFTDAIQLTINDLDGITGAKN
jgi:hypothetical protein